MTAEDYFAKHKTEDQKLEEAIDTAMVDGRISRFGCRTVARGHASYEKKRILTGLLEEIEDYSTILGLDADLPTTGKEAVERVKSIIQKHIENE